ncbi:MAG: hypothetical protein IKR18_11595 [Bacteroidaceae bacterium]|nr:hypothetical protein [Bacteroidaceae bacterium]
MDDYRKLSDSLRALNERGRQITIAQGIVQSVDGITCSVRIGDIVIPDVRLRASESANDSEMLVVPRTGTAVTVGSLSGDLGELVVLKVDAVEKVVINGGSLGGLVNIDTLTQKLNELVDRFNSHTHTCASPGSPTSPVAMRAQNFRKNDYEDKNVKH